MGDRSSEIGVMQFEDLDAWKKGRELVAAIYHISRTTPLAKDFALRDQIQRAAISAMTNIAEGFERIHPAEKKQFYNVARASCGETRSLLYVALDAGHIDEETLASMHSKTVRVGQLISGLTRSLEKRSQTQSP